MTVREALAYAAERLSSVTDEAWTEARLLLAELTGLSPSALRLSGDTLDEAAFVKLEGFIKRRLLREPLQYVLGEWYFMGLPFCVSPAALIPRHIDLDIGFTLFHMAAPFAYRIIGCSDRNSMPQTGRNTQRKNEAVRKSFLT